MLQSRRAALGTRVSAITRNWHWAINHRLADRAAYVTVAAIGYKLLSLRWLTMHDLVTPEKTTQKHGQTRAHSIRRIYKHAVPWTYRHYCNEIPCSLLYSIALVFLHTRCWTIESLPIRGARMLTDGWRQVYKIGKDVTILPQAFKSEPMPIIVSGVLMLHCVLRGLPPTA